jgi:pimeloyl-ACP methyl ester carboxylesterase
MNAPARTAHASVINTPTMSVKVTTLGDGQTLVYLHDILFDHVSPEGEIPEALQLLAKSQSVHIPSLPGFSDLAQLEQVHTVGDYVVWLEDVLSGLGLERPHLVGTGFGAWIAAEYAVRGSAELRTLTLVNAFGLRVEGHPTARFFYAAAPNPLEGRREVRELLFSDPDSVVAQLALPDHPEDQANVRFFNSMHAAARIGWQPPTFYDLRLGDQLGRVKAPTHIVWGSQNALVDVAHGEAYRVGIKNSTLTLIEGAGHAVVLEQPEELVKVVASFIEQHE